MRAPDRRGPAAAGARSTSSRTSGVHAWPAPSSASAGGSTPSTCSRSFATSRGSSIRARIVGTTAAAASMSAWTRLDTASCVACSCGSRTESRPSGLSSRITSPVSVIHDVVGMPANDSSARNAGVGRPPVDHHFAPADVHRHRRVGQRGRVEHHEAVGGAVGEAGAGQAATQVEHQGRRLGERPRLRCGCRRRCGSSSVSLRPSSRPDMVSGPVPGSSEKSKERSVKARSTRAVVLQDGRRGGAEQRHLQPAVFLQLEAVVGRHAPGRR